MKTCLLGHAWTSEYGCSEKEEEFQWLIKWVLDAETWFYVFNMNFMLKII